MCKEKCRFLFVLSFPSLEVVVQVMTVMVVIGTLFEFELRVAGKSA